MVLLASLSTSLLIAAVAVLVLALGGGAAYVLAQSRRRAAAEAERVAEEASQRDAELAHIRQRIEEIYERQQTGSETQFARVNQELEQLQMNLDAKGRQIDGVQGQLRYQLKRHEDEIDELRNQLREAVEVFAAAALPAARPSAPALEAHTPPPAAEPERSAPPKPAAPPAPEPSSTPEPAANIETPAFAPLGELLKDDHELLDDLFSGTDLDSENEPPAPAPFAPARSVTPSAPPPRPEPAPAQPTPVEPEDAETPSFPSIPEEVVAEQLETRDDFEFVEIDPPASVPLGTEAVEAAAPSQPETSLEDDLIEIDSVAAWPAEPTAAEPVPSHSGDGQSTSSFDDPFADSAAVFHPEAATDLDSATLEVPPTNPRTDPLAAELTAVEEDLHTENVREDLTAISSVDDETQEKLYALGITEIEEIARWTRADARRMATQLADVSEEDIMDRWVFEAQSILFERYQDELREQREQHLNA